MPDTPSSVLGVREWQTIVFALNEIAIREEENGRPFQEYLDVMGRVSHHLNLAIAVAKLVEARSYVPASCTFAINAINDAIREIEGE